MKRIPQTAETVSKIGRDSAWGVSDLACDGRCSLNRLLDLAVCGAFKSGRERGSLHVSFTPTFRLGICGPSL